MGRGETADTARGCLPGGEAGPSPSRCVFIVRGLLESTSGTPGSCGHGEPASVTLGLAVEAISVYRTLSAQAAAPPGWKDRGGEGVPGPEAQGHAAERSGSDGSCSRTQRDAVSRGTPLLPGSPLGPTRAQRCKAVGPGTHRPWGQACPRAELSEGAWGSQAESGVSGGQGRGRSRASRDVQSWEPPDSPGGGARPSARARLPSQPPGTALAQGRPIV